MAEEGIMRIMVRGWGRNQGEKELMNADLRDAEEPAGHYIRGKTYFKVVNPDYRNMTKVRISTDTELRLGGNYLLQVELSRKDIARLFYETHDGDIVKMFRSFVEDEELRERVRWLERHRQRLADMQQLAETEEPERPE
jgi:hypothetical protein